MDHDTATRLATDIVGAFNRLSPGFAPGTDKAFVLVHTLGAMRHYKGDAAAALAGLRDPNVRAIACEHGRKGEHEALAAMLAALGGE